MLTPTVASVPDINFFYIFSIRNCEQPSSQKESLMRWIKRNVWCTIRTQVEHFGALQEPWGCFSMSRLWLKATGAYFASLNTQTCLGIYIFWMCPFTTDWQVGESENLSFLAMTLCWPLTVPRGIQLKVLMQDIVWDGTLAGLSPLPRPPSPIPLPVFSGNTFLIHYLHMNPCLSSYLRGNQPKTSAMTC